MKKSYKIIISLICVTLLILSFSGIYKKALGIRKRYIINTTKNIGKEVQDNLKIKILVSVNNKIYYSSRTVKFNDKVKLYLVIEKNGIKYCDNKKLLEKGLAKPLKNLKGFNKRSIKWSKIEAQNLRYCSKAGYNQFKKQLKSPLGKKALTFYFNKYELDKFKYIAYTYKKRCTSVNINQKSKTNYSIKLDDKYVGTMRYAVSVKVGKVHLSTPNENFLNTINFDKMDKVLRISVRGNTQNDILDYAFSYANLPYYFGSNSRLWGWYGSDCAKYVCVVYWRLGYGIPYLSTLNLINYFEKKANITGITKKGFYLNKGKKIKYGKDINIGDPIVISPTPHYHAGFIGEDKNNNGFLDKNDFVLHTSQKAPKYEKLGKTSLGKPHKNLFILKFF